MFRHRIAAVVVGVVVGSVGIVGPAHATGTPGPHHTLTHDEYLSLWSGETITWVQFWNTNSHMVLAVQASSDANGAAIIQWDANYQSNGLPAQEQAWALRNPQPGPQADALLNAGTNPMKAVGISASSTTNGAHAIQWTYQDQNPDQRWELRWSDSTTFTIRNLNSGKCLGISAGSKTHGAIAIQWECTFVPDQTWTATVYP